MPKHWKLLEPDVQLKNQLASQCEISSLFAQLLINRGVMDAASVHSFLTGTLENLYDPLRMKGMERAVNRLRQALDRREPIFVSTDFDVDGVTSCALLETELNILGGRLRNYVPHRIRDGYGLNQEAVEQARQFGARVFIALDCGITAHREVETLNRHHIDVIIIDHHEPGEKVPPAFAILNPKQVDCPYPFKELASVGLVYKLLQALVPERSQEHLDLVALGTVADVAPLLEENRILVRHGLEELKTTRRHGLLSLMAASGMQPEKMSTRAISFILAPRLNASGRIDSARTSLDLLLCQDSTEADRLAGSLNQNNRDRQKIEERVMTQAVEMIERCTDFSKDFVIVVGQQEWHPGVVGIVASKLAERYYRPAIVISLNGGVGRGSARSIQDFHLYEALSRCQGHLVEYGGHKYAAGLTIEEEKIGAFRQELNEVARQHFQKDKLLPVVEIDAQIPFSLITPQLVDLIEQLSPYGEANRRPIFVSRNVMVKSKPAVMGKNTLKFWASDGDRGFEAVGFGLGDYVSVVNQPGQLIDMAYCLGWSEWKGQRSIQVEIKDLRPSQ